ncbi:MAG TPA: AMP-binding protein, partial [Pseudonocardia sp.]|nr:AMP-binding protein [Pseudonocardia sp.]
MPGLDFVSDLRRHGERTALVGPGGGVSYRELDERVRERAAALGPGRRLTLVATAPGADSVVSYLAALRAGHAALLVGDGDERVARLVAAYRPDTVVRPGVSGAGPVIEVDAVARAGRLHPELALLLSTSGSSGSPKLVRLSAHNLASNAAAITAVLPIRADDRAPLMLPLHYCYGLSVVNSNLARGAALLPMDHPVSEPGFWTTFRAHGATSLHGVPYTFDLLDAVGFAGMELPELRYVTQAGGRWAAEDVRRYAELGRTRGWELHVMYGQTEATARMAVLPPRLAASAPSAVGLPVPGGDFRIDDPAPDGAGELVFRGPGVMLGYADGPADLARGRTVQELVTGDRARRRPDGLIEIVGRSSRFIKPFGLRVDLDDVERLLAAAGIRTACTGDDTELVVVTPTTGSTLRIRALLAARLPLPADAMRVVEVGELPRTAAGKVDGAALAVLARPAPTGPTAEPAAGLAGDPVRTAFRAAFPGQRITDADTFVALGGDSLTYVRTMLRLQRAVGRLPADWPTTAVGRLARLAPQSRWWVPVETPVVLRAVAIVLVVGSHVGAFRLLGGAHVLLAVAGWAFARFVLAPGRERTSRAVLGTLARIAVPSVLWITCRALTEDDVGLTNALLVNYLLDPHAWGYWFVETLAQILLLLALVFAVPAVRRRERAAPFAFAGIALAVALTGLLVDDRGHEFSARLMSPHQVLWLFVLGWLVQRADSGPRRVLAVLAVAVLVPAFFGAEPLRAAVVTVGVLLLVVPTLPVPRPLVAPVGAVAAASLTIYLGHYAIFPELTMLPGWAATALCLALPVALHLRLR